MTIEDLNFGSIEIWNFTIFSIKNEIVQQNIQPNQ